MALKIESKTVTLPATESAQKIEDEVVCADGFGVTGGGFSCSSSTIIACAEGLSIIASEPSIDGDKGTGWHIIATYIGAPAQLTIRAICAQLQ
jgi:hypothetical protein